MPVVGLNTPTDDLDEPVGFDEVADMDERAGLDRPAALDFATLVQHMHRQGSLRSDINH